MDSKKRAQNECDATPEMKDSPVPHPNQIQQQGTTRRSRIVESGVYADSQRRAFLLPSAPVVHTDSPAEDDSVDTIHMSSCRLKPMAHNENCLWMMRPQNKKWRGVSPSRPVIGNLTWSHIRTLLRVTNEDARMWYLDEAAQQMWSVRTLDRNISSQYYHRLLQSPQKEAVITEMKSLTASYEQDKLEFIKNPVVAEFLGLAPNMDFTESKLESAILTHIQKFLMEMGKGYAFVARQQHISTDAGDYFIDLVFYNYILKCFLLIDLKTSQISHQDVGQMDMSVRMYDDLKLAEGDNPTIGLILCSETNRDIARYSVLHENPQLFTAKYLTYLPSEEELRKEIEQQKEVFRLQQD